MTLPYWPPGGLFPLLDTLQAKYLPDLAHYDVPGLLRDPQLGPTAVVSSFGAESAAMLHYVNTILPDVPVLFIDTGKHFQETLEYRDQLTALLGLNTIDVFPSTRDLEEQDADGMLYKQDPTMCCNIRKVFSLQDALVGYSTWISGRKRFQSRERANVGILEADGARIKINPMALWKKTDLETYFEDHALPKHPLEKQGYLSIGCAPCTRPVRPGEDARAGRWADTPDKSECGLHLGPDGRLVRAKKP